MAQVKDFEGVNAWTDFKALLALKGSKLQELAVEAGKYTLFFTENTDTYRITIEDTADINDYLANFQPTVNEPTEVDVNVTSGSINVDDSDVFIKDPDDGTEAKVESDGALRTREQNLDSDGRIRNSAHLKGSDDGGTTLRSLKTTADGTLCIHTVGQFEVQEDGSSVVGSPAALNFLDNFTITDAGGSVATVEIDFASIDIGDLNDVDTTGVNTDDLLTWDGSNWVAVARTTVEDVVWGDITGTLSNQIDLQAALDGKVSSVVGGTDITIDNTDAQNPIINFDNTTGYITAAGVPAAETTTTLQIIGNTLRYTNEDGVQQDIDLSLYLDDTNLSRLVSGTVDAAGIATFTRDDASTFTVDMSSLLDNQTASEVPVTPTGNLTSTDVQAALQELQTEIDAVDTFYNADGTLTGSRDVIADNTDSLTFNMYDLTSTNYNARSQVNYNSGGINLIHTTGTGAGADDDITFMTVNAAGVFIQDQIGTTGMSYAANYASSQTAGDRWIPDKGYVDSEIPDDTDDLSEGSTNLYYTEARVSANTSVAANTAKVSADGSIDTHSDVDVTTTTPSSGDVLAWDGTNFVPSDTSNGYTIFSIWAEEGAALSNNNRQWSFGNGAVGNINIVLPIDCELFAMSFDAEVGGGSDTVTIDVMQDDALSFTTKAFTGLKDFETYGTPTSFTAGQCIGFRTNTEVGALSDARVAAWFRVRSSPAATSVLNDLLDVSAGGVTNGQVLEFDGSNWVPVDLSTSNVVEGTNLYYTEARVSANTDVAANTAARHDAVTVTDSADIDFTLTGQDVTGVLTTTGVSAGTYKNAEVTVDSKGRVTSITENVYGTEFNLFESLALSTTTSTTAQTKITGTTASLPIGKYEITVSYNWNYNNVGQDFRSFFTFDGASVMTAFGTTQIHRQEPQDSGGNTGGTGSNQQHAFHQVFYVDVTTAGTKDVLLTWASSSGGVIAAIWNAKVKVIRVQ